MHIDHGKYHLVDDKIPPKCGVVKVQGYFNIGTIRKFLTEKLETLHLVHGEILASHMPGMLK